MCQVRAELPIRFIRCFNGVRAEDLQHCDSLNKQSRMEIPEHGLEIQDIYISMNGVDEGVILLM